MRCVRLLCVCECASRLSQLDTDSQSKVNEKRRREKKRGVGLLVVGGESSGTRYRLILLVNEAEELGPGVFFFFFYCCLDFRARALFLRLVCAVPVYPVSDKRVFDVAQITGRTTGKGFSHSPLKSWM